MGLSICQTCGIIVRGQTRRRCRSCKSVISRNLPTPLAVFGLKESAPVGAVSYRTDHLLLERVLEVAQTDKLVWESPCKDGECIHVEPEEGSGLNDSSSKNGDKAKSVASTENKAAEPKSEPEPASSSANETPQSSQTEVFKESEIEEEEVPEVHKGESTSWTLTTTGTSTDGLPRNIQVAVEDIGAPPLPDSQSFSATTLVFGPALDERVVTAEPQDLKDIYEQFVKENTDKIEKTKQDAVEPKKEDKATKELFEKVEKTASAIFDKPDVGGSDRDYSSEVKEATKSREPSGEDSASLNGSDRGDEWPEESYNRGTTRSADGFNGGENTDSKSPYKSEFDLSALKKPGSGTGASSGAASKSQMLKSKGSLIGAIVKFAVITVVFVTFGGVGLFFLGGSQTTSIDSGSMQVNEMGLPVLTGRWHIKTFVETPNGEVPYVEIDADVVQTRDAIVGSGVDGNGKFEISGSLGKSEETMIAFSRHYNLDDGRQHPSPIRFQGVVGANKGESILAQGSFANRLMRDLPALNKRQFEQIQGYWSLTIKSESMLDKIKKSLGI